MKTIDYSQRAENVFKQAQELVESLDEADIAQQKAKDAIKQANEDISLARADLEKVNKLEVNLLRNLKNLNFFF